MNAGDTFERPLAAYRNITASLPVSEDPYTVYNDGMMYKM